MKNFLKKLVKIFFPIIGFEIDFALDRGISLFGVNIRSTKRKYTGGRSSYALKKCLGLPIKSVLDVGSGGGEHARKFKSIGKQVTCVDYGTSIYADKFINNDGIERIIVDFNRWEIDKKYDLVWASHVLEHQQNVGLFLQKLIKLCSNKGYIAITVPFPHRHLWAGHLTLWTPGLLAYNIVLQGIDLSSSQFIYGFKETSIIFQVKNFKLPSDLTYDFGDIDKLKDFFPKYFYESSDVWF